MDIGASLGQNNRLSVKECEEGQEKGEEKATKELILAIGEDRLGPPGEAVKTDLKNVTDVARLKRMARHTPKASSWQEVLATP